MYCEPVSSDHASVMMDVEEEGNGTPLLLESEEKKKGTTVGDLSPEVHSEETSGGSGIHDSECVEEEAIPAATPPPHKDLKAPSSFRGPVALIFSKETIPVYDMVSVHNGRYALWASLCASLGVFSSPKRFHVIPPAPASNEELMEFHSSEYVSHIEKHNQNPSGLEFEAHEVYGLTEDCPFFRGLHTYIRYVAGSSLTAANKLLAGYKVAINWAGGRHHARRDLASGFCYVNDIALAILRLLESPRIKRVMYIDIGVYCVGIDFGCFVAFPDFHCLLVYLGGVWVWHTPYLSFFLAFLFYSFR